MSKSQYFTMFSKTGFGFLSFLFTLAVFFLVRNNPFFWDTIQLSAKHGYWFYDTNFAHFFLPESIDSGHPPFFGLYLALVWKIFGKSLLISHLAMFLFQWGILLQLYRIGYYFTKNNTAVWLPILAIADPVLMGQFVLVSPDIVLIFFFLLALNSILYQSISSSNTHKFILGLSAIGLAMVSMRGMMVVVVLYLFELFITSSFTKNTFSIKRLIQKALVYVPSGVFAALFLFAHYKHSGWIGYHPDSPWAESFKTNDLSEMVKHIAILGWRMLDFGRIFIWIGLFGTTFFLIKKQKIQLFKQQSIRQISALLLLSIILLSISFIRYKGLMGHRYLLPIFMVLSILLFVLLIEINKRKLRNIAFTVIAIGLFLGNFWIYPEKVAQGWDSTLAHVPYYELREKMLDYIEKENIEVSTIGTVFPEVGAFKFRDLSDNEDGFTPKDFDKNTYIYYSNVMNNFSDNEIDLLHSGEWKTVQSFEKMGITTILYRKQ